MIMPNLFDAMGGYFQHQIAAQAAVWPWQIVFFAIMATILATIFFRSR